MRQLIAIGLLSSFLFQCFGVPTLLVSHRRTRHRFMEQYKNALHEHEEFVLLTIPGDQLHLLQWIKPNKEFRYKDNLYDLIRQEQDPQGNTNFYCLQDEKEANLYHSLPSLGEGAGKQASNHALLVIKMFLSLFQALLQNSSPGLFPDHNFTQGVPFLTSYHRQFYLTPQTPPPDFS